MPIKWRPVVGYEGRYEVSDDGRVRNARNRRELTHHFVKGYHRVTLPTGRAYHKSFLVHCLVAVAFIGPRPKGYQINHRDGDLDNNTVTNLEYLTPSQNVRHSLDVLGAQRPKGERHGRTRLTDAQVVALREEYARGGVTGTELARRVGVHQVTMSHLLIRRTWRHLS